MLRHSMSRLLVVAFVLMLFVPGCSRNAITVDGEVISKEEFDVALKDRLKTHKALDAKVDESAIRKSVTDELVAEVLLVKAAQNRKITVTDADVQKAIEEMRGNKSDKDFREDLKKSGVPYDLFVKRLKNKMFISKLMNDMVKDDSVTDEEVKEFYAKNRDSLFKPEKDFVRILQLSNEADAKEAGEKIKKGEDFDALADSLAKSGKAQSTSYGWLEPDFLSREIATAMKSAQLNVPLGPYKGREGAYYLFKIKERTRQALTLSEAKPQIQNMILNHKRQELATHIVEIQRKSAKIQINT